MKITRVLACRVELPLHETTFKCAGGKSVTVLDSTIARVDTDAGIVGHGEVCPLGPFYLPAYAEGVRAGLRAGLRELGQHLLGEDAIQADEVKKVRAAKPGALPQSQALHPTMKHTLTLLAALLLASPTTLLAAAKPLNILVLHADDWRYNTLGCAGNPVVKTPQLDRLAAEGTRFTHACVTTSICGVSRASLFTGQWMSRHGNKAFAAFNTPWAETYPGLLRANGYYVGHVGKWHTGKFPADNFDFGRSYMGRHWMKNPDGTPIHVTQKNENDALEFLRTRPADKPFCLTVAFFATHAEDGNPLQYLPQPQSMELYKDVTIPLPKTATDEAFRKLPPFVANEENESRRRWRSRFDEPVKYQTMMKNYYRLATEVDTTCGRVLAELAKTGQLENTLVIFTGDNGYFHGEHGLADKWYPHEESIRVPLIIRDPRTDNAKRGETDDNFALNVDLAPTILAAVGLQVPAGMQGRNLAPLYLDAQKPTWRGEFFYEHGPIGKNIPASEALVRKGMKYMVWPEFKTEQLFDLKADPFEEHDIVAQPSAKPTLDEMRVRFSELKASAR